MKHHIEDVKGHPFLNDQNLIILSETWLSDIDTQGNTRYCLPNYTANFCNAGNGKGVASYFEDSFCHVESVVDSTYQLTKFSMSFNDASGEKVDTIWIGVYRSSVILNPLNPNDLQIISHLLRIIDLDKICIIFGDFNVDLKKDPNHPIVQVLRLKNIEQVIDLPTHNRGGIIDHLYIYRPTSYASVIIEWDLFFPFYSDHAGIAITIHKGEKVFKSVPCTVPDELLQETEPAPSRTSNRKTKSTTS